MRNFFTTMSHTSVMLTEQGRSTKLTGPGWPLKVKVLKVDRASQAGLQVISVDLETGALGRSEQIDQQALESRILSGGLTQQPQLAG